MINRNSPQESDIKFENYKFKLDRKNINFQIINANYKQES